MRRQLFLAGISIVAFGVFFLGFEPFLAVSVPLALSPAGGPPGTIVNATSTGFPPGGRVFLYWFDRRQGNTTYRYLGSGVVGPDGEFQSPVSFTVPDSELGVHNVTASLLGLGPTTAAIPGSETAGVALFNVTSGGAPAGPAGSPGEPSPLTGWGIVFIAAGLALAGLSPLAKEREGKVEPPPGTKFCVFCRAPVPLADYRCPSCNGVQPRE